MTGHPNQIGLALVKFYKSLYTKDPLTEAWFKKLDKKHYIHPRWILAWKGFSVEEIKKATFELPGDKALCPDGFSIAFFKEC